MLGADRIVLEREFPRLYQLLACYFHQEWQEEFKSPQEALEFFATDHLTVAAEREKFIASVIEELNALVPQMETTPPAKQQKVLMALGCDYNTEADGKTPAEWLKEVRHFLDKVLKSA